MKVLGLESKILVIHLHSYKYIHQSRSCDDAVLGDRQSSVEKHSHAMHVVSMLPRQYSSTRAIRLETQHQQLNEYRSAHAIRR